jgi:hypothetical protein
MANLDNTPTNNSTSLDFCTTMGNDCCKLKKKCCKKYKKGKKACKNCPKVNG